ncbi:MAG: BrnT family toxin [Pseudomonadota bacterium]
MITYDASKRHANIVKHGIDMATLSSFFDGELLTREDTRVAYGELRFQSVGWHIHQMLFVVWTPGENEWPHIISARKAEKHERQAWTRFCR